MSKARLVITAVTVEKRPVSEVARSYGVARSWIYTLLARYAMEGEEAFERRSRRPKTSPRAIPDTTISLITELRKELAGQGLDAGPHTIAWHLEHHHQVKVSAAAISRCLARAGLVVPEPAKRPKSSCIRFAADLPNECWQADFTHYPLAGGSGTEILTWPDDHSRYVLSLTAHHRVTGPAVVTAFRAAVAAYGAPALTLTGNGMVFTGSLAAAQQILADDPYQIAVVFESAQLCPWEIMKANPALISRCDEEPSAHVEHAYGAEVVGPEDRACLRRAGLLGEAFEHDSDVVHQDIDRAAAVEDVVDTSPSDLSERTRAQAPRRRGSRRAGAGRCQTPARCAPRRAVRSPAQRRAGHLSPARRPAAAPKAAPCPFSQWIGAGEVVTTVDRPGESRGGRAALMNGVGPGAVRPWAAGCRVR